jgi:XTP/dITP diphosphohydrolase
MDLLFGTTNPGKLRELRRLVEGLPIRVVSPGDLGRPLPEVDEDGRTFAENAAKKAAAWARFSGLHALADDSGLCLDALDGEPGVRSARWSEEEAADGRAARDERNNDKLLRALAAVPEERRGAEYRAVLAVARPDGSVVASVTGVCRGRIGRARRGTDGFGYDPLFVPDAETRRARGEPGWPARTMAEMSPQEKDAISHRGEAFRRLRPVLEALVRALDENGPKR